MYNILLKGGEVHDGAGRVLYGFDVAIKDGLIVEITKDIPDTAAEMKIDVTGLIVPPGFIDMHTHSDSTLIAYGRAESQVHQGVTTEVISQCGISCALFLSHENIRQAAPWYTEKAKHGGWLSFAEHLDALDETTLWVNVMAFVGHGTIHRAVMGDQLQPGEPDDIVEMVQLVDKCMEEGAGGFSWGLEYYPSIFSCA